MTGSVASKDHEAAHAAAMHFVDLENVRLFKAVAAPGDVLSTFTWAHGPCWSFSWLRLPCFYRETRGMIGMAFIQPSIGIKRISS